MGKKALTDELLDQLLEDERSEALQNLRGDEEAAYESADLADE